MTNECFKLFYAPSETFKLTNPNPRWKSMKGMRWDTGDCAIRALANAVSIEWITAYDYLSIRAREDYAIPNDMGFFRKWIVDSGAKWFACKAVAGKKRMTVKEFAEKNKDGRYIIQIANHLTACVDGVVLDAWNPGKKCVVGYFDMSDFKID